MEGGKDSREEVTHEIMNLEVTLVHVDTTNLRRIAGQLHKICSNRVYEYLL